MQNGTDVDGAAGAAGALPRDPGDIPCGRELDTIFTRGLMKIFEKLRIHNETQTKHLLSTVRQIIHMAHVEIPNYRTDAVADNRELRIKYLRKYISEDGFKQVLQKNHKKNSKKHEIMEVLQMMVLTCTDILHRMRAELNVVAEQQLPMFSRIVDMVSDTATTVAETFVANQKHLGHKICKKYTEEIQKLTEYANGCLTVVGTTYGCVPLMFDSHLYLRHVPRTNNRATVVSE